MLVTQSPARPRGRRYAITFARRAHDAKPPEIYVLPTESDTYKRVRDPRSILITGASSGIGAALARAYAAPRTRLAICGRDTARLATVANLCRERGAEVIETCLDVTEAPAVAAWIDTADRASPLELVIANAGVQGGLWRDGAGETLGELHRVMEVNFGGVSTTIHPVLSTMRRRRRGQIALIASLAALRGLPYSPGYCASKAAVRIYGEALRSWLAPEGIDVSVVLLGFVETRLSNTVSGPKPLILSPERAAGIIRRGLAKGRRQIAFPYPLYLSMQLMRALPAGLVDTILRRVAVDIGPYA